VFRRDVFPRVEHLSHCKLRVQLKVRSSVETPIFTLSETTLEQTVFGRDVSSSSHTSHIARSVTSMTVIRRLLNELTVGPDFKMCVHLSGFTPLHQLHTFFFWSHPTEPLPGEGYSPGTPGLTSFLLQMVFESKVRREGNLRLATYLAAPSFIGTVGWKRENSGNNLVLNTTGEDAVCIVVGTVVDFRLNCGPSGAFNPQFNTPLESSKFKFVLAHPTDTIFNTDYDKAITQLKAAQQVISTTSWQK